MLQHLKDKKVASWILYDWANSTFSTTIMAGFFPLFFKEYWSQGVDSTLTTARLSSIISFSSLLIAMCSPTLGALSDRRGYKKLFVFIFMLLGVFGSFSLSLLGNGEWASAAIAYGIASIGFNASCVFYDSLLPSVSNKNNADQISSLGFGIGYLGGGVLFLVNVLMYLNFSLFGFHDATSAVKFSFVSVAAWWFIFSIPLFLFVPEKKQDTADSLHIIAATIESAKSLFHTVKKLFRERNMLWLMLAFWLYIDGVYTVITMAVDFGLSIGISSSVLISSLLIVQFVGFPFAILFGRLAEKYNARNLILFCIAIYCLVTSLAAVMQNETHFYILAFVIAIAQGAIQALSRSLFSKLTPAESSGEYFGLFNLIGKFAAIGGPIIVGGLTYLSGSHRIGMLGLLILFISGAYCLLKVKIPSTNDAA